MTTGAELVAAEAGREGGALPSTENSDRGVPLRAESAANGETKDRGGVGASGFLGSGARVNLRSAVAGRLASTPLSNCSSGKRRCAWASFKSPSSR